MQLYKKDTKGKTRYLKIWSEGATIFNESGVLNTDSPIVQTKIAKGKNIGKANETTPEEQAKLEIESYITKKLREGYFSTINEMESTKVILPMLAKSYDKEVNKIDWRTAYHQNKLDGCRTLAFINNGSVRLMSRKGVPIENMVHIEKELSEIFTDSKVILDGELYVHGEGFQTNMSYIKKYKEGFSERIKFNVYDIVSNEGQIKRFNVLGSVRSRLDEYKAVHTEVLDTYKINSEDDLKKYHTKAIEEGYEGSMIRWGNESYKVNGRSSNLLKYKDFIDETFTIVDIISSEQRPEWGTPVFDGFKAGTKMSHEERVDLLLNKDKYIGKTAEIRFFEYTDDGLPRFPIMYGIRLDK